MKKVALIFVLVVFAPSLVLAWLALRSLHNQQLVLERNQARLYQRVADSLAREVNDSVASHQREFGKQVEIFLAANKDPGIFDEWLVREWPLARVGFAVDADAKILSPSPARRAQARQFLLENSRFLTNREIVAVYNSLSGKGGGTPIVSATLALVNTQNLAGAIPVHSGIAAQGTVQTINGIVIQPVGSVIVLTGSNTLNAALLATAHLGNLEQIEIPQGGQLLNPLTPNTTPSAHSLQNSTLSSAKPSQPLHLSQIAIEPREPLEIEESGPAFSNANFPSAQNSSTAKNRNVTPERNENLPVSRVTSTDAEFREIIANAPDGTLARFSQNKLEVMFWHRPADDSRVFGAQVELDKLVERLRKIIATEQSVSDELCAVLLDENTKPVALSREKFSADWKRPFVASEIGQVLPHWEIALYPLDPAKLHRSARVTQFTIALLVAMLVGAIGVGGWLIVSDLRRELTLARRKTDFVSNVSHELKTPLTSIRMFSDLLAEGRVAEENKRRAYLGIISTEAARLTRLINNVLDFAKLERGEKKYQFEKCDVAAVVRDTLGTFRPHLEQNGFRLECALPNEPVIAHGDRDAISQVLVNLISNAEKYSNGSKEIRVELEHDGKRIAMRVLDRGPGVPRGAEKKIFEKFYRAHDSLHSGIEGTGLGLALSRQIARAHGGDVIYVPRVGGGSCFVLNLPEAN